MNLDLGSTTGITRRFRDLIDIVACREHFPSKELRKMIESTRVCPCMHMDACYPVPMTLLPPSLLNRYRARL